MTFEENQFSYIFIIFIYFNIQGPPKIPATRFYLVNAYEFQKTVKYVSNQFEGNLIGFTKLGQEAQGASRTWCPT